MWDPQHLTTLYTFTACYGDSFTLLYFTLLYTKAIVWCRVQDRSYNAGTIRTRVNEPAMKRKAGTEKRCYESGVVDITATNKKIT
jgi:hypothetical protein